MQEKSVNILSQERKAHQFNSFDQEGKCLYTLYISGGKLFSAATKYISMEIIQKNLFNKIELLATPFPGMVSILKR